MKKNIIHVATFSVLVVMIGCSKPASDDGIVTSTSSTTTYGGSGYNPSGVGGNGAGTTASGYYLSATIDGVPYTCYTVGNAIKSKPPAIPRIVLGGNVIINGDTFQMTINIPNYYGTGVYYGQKNKSEIEMANFKGPTNSYGLPQFASSGVANDLTVPVISDNGTTVKGAFTATVYDVISMFNGNTPLDTMKIENGSFYLKY